MSQNLTDNLTKIEQIQTDNKLFVKKFTPETLVEYRNQKKC